MYEIWWRDGDTHEMRAKFRNFEDALRYAWRHGRAEDAELRFPDGQRNDVSAFEMPSAIMTVPAAPSERVPAADVVVLPRAPRIDPSDVALEVMETTGLRDAKLVQRVVRATISVLNRLAAAKHARRPPRRR